MRIDPVLYHGRPADRRIEKEERCYTLLDSLGLDYARVDHDFADTIEACHEIEKLLGCEICKNLLLTNRQMTAIYLLLMPVLSCFIGVFFLNEDLTVKKILGILVVLTGAAVILQRGRINHSGRPVRDS